MQQKNHRVCLLLILTSSLFHFVHSAILTNLCSSSSTCNCTLTDTTNLDIVCSSTLSLTALPTLSNSALQTGVTQLSLTSSVVGTRGPLISLPTNLCASYPNIAVLDLSSNGITGFLNTSLLACLGSNLISVDFSENFISDIDLNFFQANKQLQAIDLSINNLTTMPMIDGPRYVNFTSTITLMNFSYNQIINVDFWPIFVRTNNYMTIDMSNNLITNCTNQVPVDVAQLSETPDARYFYLNNNLLERLSDLSLEQYGGCSTISSLFTAYFIVGISNILLTENPLICDCQSYYLVSYVHNSIMEFPQIYNGTALLTQALCTAPLSAVGQRYILANFTQTDECSNYTLPNQTDIFCSVYTNSTRVTLTTPIYWPNTAVSAPGTTGVGITTGSNPGGGVNDASNSGSSSTSGSSGSPSWYIILGIVLGLLLILFLILLAVCLCKDRLFPGKFRSKIRHDEHSLDNPFEPIIHGSALSSHTNFPLNGLRPHGGDDRDNRMLQLNDNETFSNRTSVTSQSSWDGPNHPGDSKRGTRQTTKKSRRERKSSSLVAADASTNTTNVVKGIPVSSTATKVPSMFPSNSNTTVPDTNTSELSMTSIPITPSKRARLLPQIKTGMYADSTNSNTLNTSAGGRGTGQRQRRRSAVGSNKQHGSMNTSLPIRPQSTIGRKPSLHQDDSSEEEMSTIPTRESLPRKEPKPFRTLPLLNISVVPAWIDDDADQK